MCLNGTSFDNSGGKVGFASASSADQLAMSRHGELTLAARTVMQIARDVAKSSVGGLMRTVP